MKNTVLTDGEYLYLVGAYQRFETYAYHPLSNSWKQGPNLKAEHYLGGCAWSPAKQSIYVLGGGSQTIESISKEYFLDGTGEWKTETPIMPAGSHSFITAFTFSMPHFEFIITVGGNSIHPFFFNTRDGSLTEGRHPFSRAGYGRKGASLTCHRISLNEFEFWIIGGQSGWVEKSEIIKTYSRDVFLSL